MIHDTPQMPSSDRSVDTTGRGAALTSHGAMPFSETGSWAVESASAVATAAQTRRAESSARRAATAGTTPATSEELTKAYFDNPAQRDVQLDSEARTAMERARFRSPPGSAGGVLQSAGADAAIVPGCTAPAWAATADHAARAGDGTYAGSGVTTRVPRSKYVDRLGRVITLYESPMPFAQKDYGVKDHSGSLQRAQGLYAVRDGPRVEVRGKLNEHCTRDNDARIDAGARTESLSASAAVTAHNQTHGVGHGFEELDWKRADLYDGLNYRRDNEKTVAPVPETHRSKRPTEPPPLTAAAAVVAAPRQPRVRAARRVDAKPVAHSTASALANVVAAPRTPLTVVRSAVVRAVDHVFSSARGPESAAGAEGRVVAGAASLTRQDAAPLDVVSTALVDTADVVAAAVVPDAITTTAQESEVRVDGVDTTTASANVPASIQSDALVLLGEGDAAAARVPTRADASRADDLEARPDRAEQQLGPSDAVAGETPSVDVVVGASARSADAVRAEREDDPVRTEADLRRDATGSTEARELPSSTHLSAESTPVEVVGPVASHTEARAAAATATLHADAIAAQDDKLGASADTEGGAPKPMVRAARHTGTDVDVGPRSSGRRRPPPNALQLPLAEG